MLAIAFGLMAAFSYGSGDFLGGLAGRRIGARRTVLYAYVLGLPILVLVAFLTGQLRMPAVDWLWCGAAGIVGSLGFLALYGALAKGNMSTAAPVASVTSASLPVIAGVFLEGMPSMAPLAGFALALIAIWLLSWGSKTGERSTLGFKDLAQPVLAGLGMGVYYIFINFGSQESLLGPLVASRLAGALTLFLVAVVKGDARPPSPSLWPLLAMNALLDLGGSFFYILSGQTGRMDLAAILTSLYSGVTVLLAWLVLRERIQSRQRLGILLTLAAIVLITR